MRKFKITIKGKLEEEENGISTFLTDISYRGCDEINVYTSLLNALTNIALEEGISQTEIISNVKFFYKSIKEKKNKQDNLNADKNGNGICRGC